MKMIVAIVPPARLDEVKRALTHAWIAGLTVAEVSALEPGPGHVEVHRGAEHVVHGAPSLRIELVVPDPLVPRLLHDLARAARTGRASDGSIHVTPVEGAVRIRTGERGEDAL